MSNEIFGWLWIIAGFISGAVIGMFFHREDFLGGYGSFRRRLVRLGHIAFLGLGILNILFAQSLSRAKLAPFDAATASWGMIIGAISMPTVCFLAAWKPAFRRLFFIPVVSLFIGVIGLVRGLTAN